MSSIIQFLVDEGVFEEDPDGWLWLSAKMKELIDKLERNDKFLDTLRKIEGPEEKALKRWSALYLKFIGASDEITSQHLEQETIMKAIGALAAWELAAVDRNLTEWSMKLRIR